MTPIRPFSSWPDAKRAVLEAGFEFVQSDGPESAGGTCHYFQPNTNEEVAVLLNRGKGHVWRKKKREDNHENQ
jgi:hypothetical protein